jgi:hypothetical protein
MGIAIPLRKGRSVDFSLWAVVLAVWAPVAVDDKGFNRVERPVALARPTAEDIALDHSQIRGPKSHFENRACLFQYGRLNACGACNVEP